MKSFLIRVVYIITSAISKETVSLNETKDPGVKSTPRFFGSRLRMTGVRKPLIVFAVFLLLGALFLHFTTGTKAVGWWTGGGGSWQARKMLTITNNSSSSLSANTTVAITIDTATLVSQGKLKSDCADLRILYQPSSSTTTELTRHIVYPASATCATSTATKVFIPLQASLSSASSSTDYYLYYKNPSATAPSSTDNAFDISSIDATLVCPFDGTTTCAAGETPSTETGAVRYSGSKSAMSFDGLNDNINVGTSAGTFSANQPFTMEAWVKVDDRVMSQSITRVVQFNTNLAIGFLSGGVVRFQFPTDAGGMDSTATIPVNSWFHIAGVYDGTTRYIYLNGVMVKSGAVSLAAFQPTCGSVGADYSSCNSSTPIRVVPGLVDEVRVSTIARYTSNFTPSTTPFVRDANTRLLLHLDENGDDPRVTGKVIDDSGNNFNGTINGAKYVSGLVGVDNGTSDTGNVSRQSYAGHEGVMIEEGTTNLITNPSFENSTYNTNWTTGSNLTASSMGSVPFFKFGATSSKLVASASAISGTSNMFTTNINVGSSATHMLSAYVYDGTSGNVGGIVSSSIAKLVANGVAQTTTYTDMGGGWWRLSYTATMAGAQEFGVEPQVSKLIYVDGVQLEAKAYTTTYADGSLGSSYTWTGTANNSTSTRTATDLRYSTTSNVSSTAGTISFWYKPDLAYMAGLSQGYRTFFLTSNLYLRYLSDGTGSNYFRYQALGADTSYHIGTTKNNWYHVVGTWSSGGNVVLYINNTATTVAAVSAPSLGATFDLGSSSSSAYANGTISDFRIYDTAISSTQVTDLYQSGLAGHQEQYQVDAFGDTKGQSPVSTYHMDEAQGTTVYDSTLQANNLTLGTGSSAPTWETSHTSSNQVNPRAVSLKFDGANDYISRSYDSDFDPGTDSFSVSGWFRHPSTISGQDTLLARYGSAGYKVYMNSSGYICFGIDDDSTWGPDDSACSTTSFADSKWHTFEAVKTSTTSITLYIDGKSVGSDATLAATATLNPGSSTSLYLGIDSDFASNPWDGYLDEFSFYPYARSAAQVKADYAAAQRGTTLGASADDPLTNGLVGYWKMDENTGTTTVDLSGNSNTGTLGVGASAPSWSTGKFGADLSFDGVDDTVNMGSASNLDNIPASTGGLTASIWVKPNTPGNNSNMIGKTDAGSGGWQFAVNGNSLVYFLFTTSAGVKYSQANISVSNGTWNHFVAVYNPNNDNKAHIYLNGTEVTYSIQNTFAPSTISSDSSLDVVVSGETGGGRYYKGEADEARIYNRALSPGEVQQLYNFAPGPVGYWKLDEGTGQNVNDYSGIGNSGILGTTTAASTDDATWSSGKFGGGLSFNGANGAGTNQVNIPSSPSLQINNSITISGWMNFATGNANGWQALAKKTSSYVFLVPGTGGSFSWNVYGSLTTCTESYSYSSLGTNKWYYITGSYDGSTMRIFVNGIQVDSSSCTAGTIVANNNALVFGYGGGAGAQNLTGKLDDIKIYNYARNPKQILEDMQGSRPVTTAAGQVAGATSAMVHYRFDEATGTTANNVGVGGTGYNGALGTGVSAPSWTNTGKFGKALSFDGGDKVTATIADPAYTNAISLWVNPKNSVASKTLVTAGKLTTDSSSRPVYGGCTGSALTLNAWTHIVAMSDSSSVCKIYQNGVQTASSTTGVTFGTLVNIASGSFNGSIDEVKIYSHALSPAEVKSDYSRGATATYGQALGADDSGYATDRWWEAGGASGAIVAYQPIAAASIATSYTNVANPGVLNATAGDAPTFAQGTGWTFNGTSDYLSVGTTLASGYTALIRFSGAPTSGNSKYGFCSYAGASTNYFCLGLRDAGRTSYVNGSNTQVITESGRASGVLGFSATAAYADGVNQGALSGWSGTSNQPIYIGARNNQGTADGFTAVSVQAFVVYNTSLSAEQIKAVTNAMNKLGASDTASDQPVAEWNMDEATGTSVYDSSGNGSTGTITGGVWKPGKSSSAVSFDGTNQHIDFGDPTALQFSSAFTVSGWVYLRSYPTAGTSKPILGRWNSSGGSGQSWFLGFSGTGPGSIYAWVDDNCGSGVYYILSSTTIPLNTWTHVAATYSSSTLSIYKDGKFIESAGGPATLCTSASNVRSGVTNGGTTSFDGKVDSIKAYNYARTPAQIAYDYNGGKPVAHYRMDECSGTTVNDSSGNSNTGTLTVGASGTQTTAGNCDSNSSASAWSNGKNGKFNSSLNFDGTDDYVTISDPGTSSIFDTASALTLSAWIKTSSSSEESILSKSEDSYYLTVSSNSQTGKLCSYLNGITPLGWQCSSKSVNDGSWHHVLLVYDGINRKLFIDGVLDTTTATTGSVSVGNSSVLIGRRSTPSPNPFSGQIDDVRIYNYALSSSQVKNVYNGSAAVYYGPSSGQP